MDRWNCIPQGSLGSDSNTHYPEVSQEEERASLDTKLVHAKWKRLIFKTVFPKLTAKLMKTWTQKAIRGNWQCISDFSPKFYLIRLCKTRSCFLTRLFGAIFSVPGVQITKIPKWCKYQGELSTAFLCLDQLDLGTLAEVKSYEYRVAHKRVGSISTSSYSFGARFFESPCRPYCFIKECGFMH